MLSEDLCPQRPHDACVSASVQGSQGATGSIGMQAEAPMPPRRLYCNLQSRQPHSAVPVLHGMSKHQQQGGGHLVCRGAIVREGRSLLPWLDTSPPQGWLPCFSPAPPHVLGAWLSSACAPLAGSMLRSRSCDCCPKVGPASSQGICCSLVHNCTGTERVLGCRGAEGGAVATHV